MLSSFLTGKVEEEESGGYTFRNFDSTNLLTFEDRLALYLITRLNRIPVFPFRFVACNDLIR